MSRFASPDNCTEINRPEDIDEASYAAAEKVAKSASALTLLGNSLFTSLLTLGPEETKKLLPLLLGDNSGKIDLILASYVRDGLISLDSAERIAVFQQAWKATSKVIDVAIVAAEITERFNAADDADKAEVLVTELLTQATGILLQEAAGKIGAVGGAAAGAAAGGGVGSALTGLVGRALGEAVAEWIAREAWDRKLEKEVRKFFQDQLDDVLSGPGSVIDEAACDSDRAGEEQVRPRTDPLVLDLDGDGVEIVGFRESGVYFDIDGDGSKELTSWVKADDGLLVLDRNRNGEIDGVKDLFGTEEVSGFQMLSEYDSNNGGSITAADNVFGRLRVWQDHNQNGKADKGELVKLKAAGVTAIDLHSVDVSFTVEGSIMSEKSVFSKKGGGTGLIADFWMQYHNADVFSAKAVNGRFADLDLRGMGLLSDLSAAAKGNSVLRQMIDRFEKAAESSPQDMAWRVEQIMYEWAGVTDVGTGSRGANFDGRKLAFIEAALDTAFQVNGVAADPNVGAAAELAQAWGTLYSHVMGALFAQTEQGREAKAASYFFEMNGTFSALTPTQMIAQFAKAADWSDAEDLAGYWHASVHAMDQTIVSDVDAADYTASLDTELAGIGLAGKSQALREMTHHAGRFNGAVSDDGVHTFSDNNDIIRVTGSASVFAAGGDDLIEVVSAGYGGSSRTLNGGAGNDVLHGASTDDWLDGGRGADIMAGGQGDDTYSVDNARDSIVELAYGGTDTVRSTSTFRLDENFENLTLTGKAKIDAHGNDVANVLVGNAASNVLKGYNGDDRLDGAGGADVMEGGAGRDTYVVDHKKDRIVETGSDTDTVEAEINFKLGRRLENLTLLDGVKTGTGNNLSNTLRGNDGKNVLNGKGGYDTFYGGPGNDIYIFDHTSDRATEYDGEGRDTVKSSVTVTLGSYIEVLKLTGGDDVNGTGNTLDNVLIGNGGANTLDGRDGADRLIGKGGDDIYVISSLEDKIVEKSRGGTDTVRTSLDGYRLAANLENLDLSSGYYDSEDRSGTGNSGANVITGTRGDNTLSGLGGNDTLVGNEGDDVLKGGGGGDRLDGGAGDDRMIGGGGNDTYVVDSLGDRIVEGRGKDVDTVISSVSFILDKNLENLTLSGSGNLDGQGNAKKNVIYGNSGANNIDGGGGADIMAGGAGNDTYVVDNAGDVVLEAPGGGEDLIRSSLSTVLSFSVENLTLTGVGNLSATGNSLDNKIIGNSGNNRIEGGFGSDELTGRAGADRFIWRRADDGGTSFYNSDRITDFSRSDKDKIDLSAMDARPQSASDQAFDFIGASAFSKTGQVRAYTSGSQTIVELNLDDDLSAEMYIRLDGAPELRAGDFIL